MKATNTPAQRLAIAKTVESTIKTEKLSKSLLQNINKPESTEVDVVSKKKGFKGPGHKQNRGWQQHSHSRSMTKCRNCGSAHPPRKCPAYRKECFSCRKKGHFKQFCCSSQHKRSQSRGGDSRKSRKDMHDIDQDDDTSFQMHNGRFKRIFSGVGCFPIEPVDIVLSEDNELVQKPACRVPVAMKEKFKKELHSMVKAGIISKLDRNTPTPWLNSYVIVKKPNGSLRICLDPTDLNKYIV